MIPKHEQWLQKYHPQKISDIAGNARVIRSLKEWLQSIKEYNNNASTHASKNMPVQIVFLYGPGGIGKTSLAQVLLKHYNYDIYELNSGEVRSKKRMQEILDRILNNHSVNIMKKKEKQKTMSILMDEIDGMSCGDRGGLHELFHIIKKQNNCMHPVICIGDRPYDKKISSTLYTEYQIRRPSENEIMQRLQYICNKECIKIDDITLLWIIKYGKNDVRRTIHFMQEVVYQCGNDRSIEITMEHVERVKKLTSQTKADHNLFDITRTIYKTKKTFQELHEMHTYDESQMYMMVYENLNVQLGQKDIPADNQLCTHMNVLHNLCHIDSLKSSRAYLPTAQTALCCGFANEYIGKYPITLSTPKRIQYTNILTKIANYSNIQSTFNEVSTLLNINVKHFHYVIPLIISFIVEEPARVVDFNLSLFQLERTCGRSQCRHGSRIGGI